MAEKIYHYFDYKSPYAYLAQAETYRLVEDHGFDVIWVPYTLDIPSYLGAAKLDERGEDTIGTRNAHQWRRVRYAYMDCRREANRLGLTIRGPKKIFDSNLAHIGFLFAQREGDFRRYHDHIYEKFWLRELDIEDQQSISAILANCGFDTTTFAEYCETKGRQQLSDLRLSAEEKGIFGVPSYLIGDDLYWGAERLPRVIERASRS